MSIWYARKRIEQELLDTPDDRCKEIVNEWADDERTKVCRRPLSAEATLHGHRVCGMHFRQVRKDEQQRAADEARRAAAKRSAERRQAEEDAEAAQLKIILELVSEKLGVKQDFISYSRPYRYSRWQAGDKGTFDVPFDALLKALGIDQLKTPQEAKDEFIAARKEAEAVKVEVSGPAPF